MPAAGYRASRPAAAGGGPAADHRSSRRAAHAAVDARRDRGDARAGLLCGAAIDRAPRHADRQARDRAQRRADLLIPVVKAWCTDSASNRLDRLQVHGGMGYVEETGAAQYLRDARILPIYEGTNGIQANDLVGRKLARDGGAAARELFDEIRATLGELAAPELGPLHHRLADGLLPWNTRPSAWSAGDPAAAAAGSAPYLTLFGLVAGGWLTARMALAGSGDATRLATARFYAEHYLARAPGYLPGVEDGGAVAAFDPDRL